MSKIMDDFGYRIKIPEEEFLAITLVDNGIDPYKKIKKRSLQHLVTNEYKRRLIINITGFAKRSSKNRRLVAKKLNLRRKTQKINDKLQKTNWKKLDKMYKNMNAKNRKTRRKRLRK